MKRLAKYRRDWNHSENCILQSFGLVLKMKSAWHYNDHVVYKLQEANIAILLLSRKVKRHSSMGTLANCCMQAHLSLLTVCVVFTVRTLQQLQILHQQPVSLQVVLDHFISILPPHGYPAQWVTATWCYCHEHTPPTWVPSPVSHCNVMLLSWTYSPHMGTQPSESLQHGVTVINTHPAPPTPHG